MKAMRIVQAYTAKLAAVQTVNDEEEYCSDEGSSLHEEGQQCLCR